MIGEDEVTQLLGRRHVKEKWTERCWERGPEEKKRGRGDLIHPPFAVPPNGDASLNVFPIRSGTSRVRIRSVSSALLLALPLLWMCSSRTRLARSQKLILFAAPSWNETIVLFLSLGGVERLVTLFIERASSSHRCLRK